MSNQLTSLILDNIRTVGYPLTTNTVDDVEDVLKQGFRNSKTDDDLKKAMMVAGVKIFIEAKVPEITKPVSYLEFSNSTKDFLLGLNIPGAAEAMKMKGEQ